MADKELILSKIEIHIHHPVPVTYLPPLSPKAHTDKATEPTLRRHFPHFSGTPEAIISHLANHIKSTHNLSKISSIVCLEARGFFFAPLLASRLHLPCVAVRKPGKLPGKVISTTFQKDYGPDSFEMKLDFFEGIEMEGKKVILVDDLLGMGGSIMAA